jgi:cytochrome c oxidase subunit II
MKKILGLFFVLALVIALSACGSKKGESAGAIVDPVKASGTVEASTELLIKASNKTFKFDKEEYTAKVGVPVKLTLVNESGVHGVSIADLGVKLSADQMSQTITPAKAGTYTIQCIVMCGT